MVEPLTIVAANSVALEARDMNEPPIVALAKRGIFERPGRESTL
jgi:hypothetical protein